MTPTGTIDDIIAEVARQGTLEDSPEALLARMQAALVAAGLDPAKVASALAAFKANDDRLAAAIAAVPA